MRRRTRTCQSHSRLAKSRQDVTYRQVGYALMKPIDRGTDFEHNGDGSLIPESTIGSTPTNDDTLRSVGILFNIAHLAVGSPPVCFSASGCPLNPACLARIIRANVKSRKWIADRRGHPHTLYAVKSDSDRWVRGAPRLGCAADEGVIGPDVAGNIAGRRVPKDRRVPRDGDGRLRKLPDSFERNFDTRPPDRVEGRDPEQGANLHCLPADDAAGRCNLKGKPPVRCLRPSPPSKPSAHDGFGNFRQVICGPRGRLTIGS